MDSRVATRPRGICLIWYGLRGRRSCCRRWVPSLAVRSRRRYTRFGGPMDSRVATRPRGICLIWYGLRGRRWCWSTLGSVARCSLATALHAIWRTDGFACRHTPTGDLPHLVWVERASMVLVDVGFRRSLFARDGARPPGSRLRAQALKELPQPHELVALGLLKTKPRPMTSSLKSIVVPLRYR